MSEIHVIGSMIVKNEAENLPALFASAKGVVDAWVIVDTGSTDETISVARALGDEHAAPVYIIEDAWDDDFARSRNVGLDAIEEIAGISDWNDPWILILDGDDRIDGDRKAFRAALVDPDPRIEVIGLPVRSRVGKTYEETLQSRLWHLSSGVRYRHRVHMEAGVQDLAGTSYTDAWIRHIGYEADPKRNARRTLRIAALMDKQDPHRLYVESRAHQTLGNLEEAVQGAMQYVQLHRLGKAQAQHTHPWQILARAAHLQGEVTTAVGLLMEAAQVADAQGHAAPDLWLQAVGVAGYGLLGHTVAAVSGHTGTHAELAAAPRALSGLQHGGTIEIPHNAKEALSRAGDFTWLESHSSDLEGWTPRSQHTPEARTTARPVLYVTDTNAAGQAGYLAAAMDAPCVVLQQDYIDFPLPENAFVLSDGQSLDDLYAIIEREDWFFHFVRHPVSVGALDWRNVLTPQNCLVQYLGSPLRRHADEYMAWHKHTGIMGVSAWDWTMLERSWLPYHIPLVVPESVFGERLGHNNHGSSPAWRGKGTYRICHPTTNRHFKKTDVFTGVINKLKSEGVDVEAVIIEGKSNAECLEIKRTCHATFDQFAVGIYGMSGAESLAIGHRVYSDLGHWAQSIYPDVPVCRVRTPEELFEAIKRDVSHPPIRGLWGDADTQRPQIRWARRMHGEAAIRTRWLSLYAHIQGLP